MEPLNLSKDYLSFLLSVKKLVCEAQHAALKSVNKELIRLYWDLGKMIVEKQEKLGWGKSVVETLASDLQKEFPGTSGFSSGNLWRIRNFYDIYRNDEKLAPLVREIGWSHNVIIFEKCKKPEQKEFYLINTLRSGWTKDILLRQINTKSFENHLHNQTNFDRILPENYANQAKLAVKDSYTFDFLELGDEHAEKQLQAALIGNIKRFLLELGNWYAFVGSQYRLEIAGHEYFIDLLLFHRKLKCLIAIELKVGEFIPEYKGKMEFYLILLNEKVKEPEENDSIGIIICRNKNKTIVEYSLKSSSMPIGVATYTTNSNLPARYRKFLPDADELGRKLQLV